MSDVLKTQKLDSLGNDSVSDNGLNVIIQQPDLMLNSCATTKFFIPNPPAKLVARQRLIDKLDAITEKKLTIMSAPAGFGKTTIMSKWALGNSNTINIAWVSLSEEDNELYSFWSYFIVSLRENLQDDAAESLLKMYSDENNKIENVINVLINKILVSNRKMVIILDDYHLITNKLIDQSLSYFISNMPDNIHLVLTTRTKPGIPVSKLRIKEELLEVKTDEIRFNMDEIFDLLNNVYDTQLSKKEIENINQSAEGWVSALKVIAFYVKSGDGNNTLFNDSNYCFGKHMFDYLTEEIINKYPKNIIDFLYKTSIFQFLNSSICNRVLQIDNSQEILDVLLQNNTFIVTLSDKQDYYRYQHIFSEFLENGLRKYYSDEIDELYLRVSRWYEENELYYEAVDASLKSKDYENSARLLDKYINRILDDVELLRLVRVIKSLPIEVMKQTPRICVFYSCALAIMGMLQEDQYLNSIGIHLEDEEFDCYRAFLYSIRGYESFSKPVIDTAIADEYGRKALAALSEDDPLAVYVKSFALSSVGTVAAINGEYEEAYRYLELSQNSIIQSNSLVCKIVVVMQNALLLSNEGKVDETIELFRNTIKYLEDKKQHKGPCTNVIHLCTSISYYDIDELEKAYQSAVKTLELSRAGNDTVMQLCAYIMQTKILFAQAKKKEALEIVKSIEEIDYSDSILYVFRHFRTDWIRTIINMNDPYLLSNIVKKFKIEFTDNIIYDNEEKNIAAIEILILNNKYNEAEQNVTKIFELASKQKRRWSMVKLLILHAIIKNHQGDNERAMELFGQAVDYSKDCGYIRLFVDFGQEVKNLLIELVNGIEIDAKSNEVRAYANMLIAKFEKASCESETRHEIRDNNTFFSPRELEVFESIVEGLTNEEISAKLYISTSTVKKHIKSIYVKLKVNNRTKAIKIAKEMNVI